MQNDGLMLNNVTSSSAASHFISLKMKGWDSWWKQLKSSVCVPRRPLGSNPRLSALIWLPAGGRPALKSLPSFWIVERGIFALWRGGGDRNLLVIRDGKFNLVWRERERGREREPHWVLESHPGSIFQLLPCSFQLHLSFLLFLFLSLHPGCQIFSVKQRTSQISIQIIIKCLCRNVWLL